MGFIPLCAAMTSWILSVDFLDWGFDLFWFGFPRLFGVFTLMLIWDLVGRLVEIYLPKVRCVGMLCSALIRLNILLPSPIQSIILFCFTLVFLLR